MVCHLLPLNFSTPFALNLVINQGSDDDNYNDGIEEDVDLNIEGPDGSAANADIVSKRMGTSNYFLILQPFKPCTF